MRRPLLVLAACGGASAPPPAASSSPPHDHAQHEHHDHHGPLVHRFDNAEQWAPVFDDPKRDAWQQPDKVVAALSLSPGMTVADIGAGTGYFEKRLSVAVGDKGRVFAVDLEASMVKYLGDRAKREGMPNVEARQATETDPSLPRTSVDRIVIVDTWHHIADREAYAGKLAQTLRPGGFVLVVDFTQESEHGPPKQMRVLPAQVMKELEAAGLHASTVDVGLPEQFVVKGAL